MFFYQNLMLGKAIQNVFRLFRRGWKRYLTSGPVLIQTYESYANYSEVIVRGRVLENKGVVVNKNDGFWKNFRNNLKHLGSNEIEFLNVEFEFVSQVFKGQTDNEGYFEFCIEISDKNQFINRENSFWKRGIIRLSDNQYSEDVFAEVSILWPNSKSKFGVISDIDDTILKTYVSSWMRWQMIYVTLFKNVYQRRPFDGMNKALNFLAEYGQANGVKINPHFYVSNSPWNLYEMLWEFFKINDFPRGPILLRDYGVFFRKRLKRFRDHKENSIVHLMDFYGDLPFILIGDATERDADIYLDTYRKYRKRVLAIFIRETSRQEANQRVLELIDKNSDAPIYFLKESTEIITTTSELNIIE